MGEVNNADVEKAISAIGVVILNERQIDLLAGHRNNIAGLARQFAEMYKLDFVVSPMWARRKKQFSLDMANPSVWKNSTTADWSVTPTGLGTFDEIFTETASQAFVLTTTPEHWAYLSSIMEIGSSNNMVRGQFQDINGTKYARGTVWQSSRFGSIKMYKLGKAIVMKERGQLDYNTEFQNTAPTEVVPLAAHLMPQEILAASDLTGFITTATT